MRVFIASGSHSFTDIDARIQECEEALNDPEVVFTEAPVRSPSKKERIELLLYAPLLMVTAYIWMIFLSIFRIFLGDDRAIESYFKEEYDTDIVKVDISHVSTIQEGVSVWGPVNWFAILSPLFLLFTNIGVSSVSLRLYLWFLFVQGVVIFLGYLAGMHAYRNLFMAEKIAEHQSEYSEGYLVTGERHHRPIKNRLSEKSSITVVDEENSDSSGG